MKCAICRNGETSPGKVTVTFDRDGATVVVRGVPAELCDNCGEEYVSQEVAAKLEKELEGTFGSGVILQVRDFAA